MTRKNPHTGTHPDLFEGKSRVYVPLSDLTEKQIMKLPRDAFSDDEWDEVDDDTKEYIYTHDKVSKERVEEIHKGFVRQWNWSSGRPQQEGSEDTWAPGVAAESDVEAALGYNADKYDLLQKFQKNQEDSDNAIYGPLLAGGFTEDQVDDAVFEALTDASNWEFRWADEDAYGDYGGALFVSSPIAGYIGFGVEEIESTHEDEMLRAFKFIYEDTNGNIDYGVAVAREAKQHARDGEQWSEAIDTGRVVLGDPKLEDLLQDVKNELGDEEPAGDEQAVDQEERILMRWEDDFYLLDLQVSEMPAEGKTQRMCVGDPAHGYMQGVRKGEIKVMSLRRPSGKPLLTFEIELNKDGSYAWVEQAVGKANRKPGWNPGEVGTGKFKAVEYQRALDVFEFLELDPADADDMHPPADVGDHAAVMGSIGVRKNPACGHDGGCVGFCVPYRSRR